MSFVKSTVIPVLEKKLPKVITPRAHGFIDYAHAAFFFTMGLICRRSNKAASAAAFSTGAVILVQSLITDYPLGVKPLISFGQHGEIDTAFASSSWAIPQLFGFAGTPAAKVFEINSVTEAAVVGMTNWDSDLAHQQRLESTSR